MSNESTESLPESSTTAATADNNNNIQGEQSSDGPLTPFYEQLLQVSFPDSVTAIEHCRDLCAQFGFTVKQEASTHRNIYVYCSREGLPDSLRNPKANPKRKRPSKRCDCRWRVVLYEQNGHWEFRKSLNPDAAKHNHELMRPEDIDRNWPKKVIDLIYELARTNLPTSDIRSKVQAEFPDISWNERRFYNRLSEERQKIKHREAAVRARHLTQVWGRVCMAASGNEELSGYVENEITKVLYATCQMAKLDPQSLHPPMFAGEPREQDSFVNESDSNIPSSSSTSSSLQNPRSGSMDMTAASSSSGKKTTTGSTRGQRKGSQSKQKAANAATNAATTASASATTHAVASSSSSSSTTPSMATAPFMSKPPDPPKGFTTVVIPQVTYFVKIHSQRVANEIQLTRNPRRSRSISTSEETSNNSGDIMPPARKLSRRSVYPGPPIQPQPPTHQPPSQSSPDINVMHRMSHSSSLPTTTTSVHHHHHQQQQQQADQQRSSMLDPQQQQQQQQSFVYHTGYDQQGIPIQSTIPGYEFHRFHPSYNLSPTGSTNPGFAPPPNAPTAPPPPPQQQHQQNEMPPPSLQPFDPSNSVVRTTNEPTIHPALQSNPITHRPSQQQQQQPQPQPQTPPSARRDSTTMYPLVSAPGVYQLAAAAAVVTSREEEIRQQQTSPQQQHLSENTRDRSSTIYMHPPQSDHTMLPSYQAGHAPDTPMPGRDHHDTDPHS
ncbi:hypothetical protein BDA99DRAFT_565728 [Phascolomyces articulosus]|uniref:FAR1 domain-containing protein n=1 Tax=Phascolomyces articulosus TaxID=60185 RepID=A0AAD5JYN7_9FUNG|nr:hypothetical protein BDA99DRAFT_565728 [Phascolomyces articulosus]